MAHRKGFSLIEIILALGVLAVLAGLTAGAGLAWRTGSVGKWVRIELGMLAHALEEYRAWYGEYPHVVYDETGAGMTSGEMLFSALTGERGPGNQVLDPAGRSFIDPGRFRGSTGEGALSCLIDPWGAAYRYYFRNPGSVGEWRRPDYLLYSKGPSGEHAPPGREGHFEREHPLNRDNVYP